MTPPSPPLPKPFFTSFCLGEKVEPPNTGQHRNLYPVTRYQMYELELYSVTQYFSKLSIYYIILGLDWIASRFFTLYYTGENSRFPHIFTCFRNMCQCMETCKSTCEICSKNTGFSNVCFSLCHTLVFTGMGRYKFLL